MAHELEMQEDGTARMFYAGTAPWHGLGTAVEKELTWEGAIRLAGLDRWNVQLAPLGALTLGGTWEEIEGRQAIMRGMDGQVFGIVTDAYEVIQNEEAGSFLESLVGEGLALFDTAGSLFGGRRVFVCCKLPDSMAIGPDQVDKYLVALWGHDGTMAFHIKWTPIRVVCWNTASAAFEISGGKVHATDCVSIVHRSNWKDRAAEAREALELPGYAAVACRPSGQWILVLQHVLHAGDKLRIGFGRNYPTLLEMRPPSRPAPAAARLLRCPGGKRTPRQSGGPATLGRSHRPPAGYWRG